MYPCPMRAGDVARASVTERRLVLFAAPAFVLVACRGLLGIDEDRPVLSDTDASVADAAAPDDAGAEHDGGESDALLDAATSVDADTATVEADWPAWPLPPSSPGSANYDVTGDTVTDKTTKLMWQRSFSDEITYANAASYCEGVSAGGLHDWRVPSWIELASIVDFGRSWPAVDTTAFPETPSAFFWSNTLVVRGNLRMGIFFARGEVTALSTNEAQRLRVRCVRKP